MSAAEPSVQREPARHHPRLHAAARALAGPAILFVICWGFFWKILLTKQYTWLASYDLASQVVPWLDYEAKQFHLGRFPLWDPYIFGGQSLIGQAQSGLAYPLNWILFAMPLRHGHISFNVLDWYYFAIHYLAALFCYLLCRDLGRSRTASILGGISFALGGYIGATDWPQMINGAIWGPLVFLFLFRAARGLRPYANAAFSGLFLGIAWLSGHHQVPIFLTLACAGVWLYFLFHEPRRINWTLAKAAALFFVFLLFTSAFQTWPAYAYGQTAIRWVGAESPVKWNEPVPYIVHQRYSLSPIYLLGTIIPGYAADANPFVGIAGLSLAALALACWWKIREVRVLAAVGIAGLLLALARNDVFHGMMYSLIPMFEKARSPGVALYLFHFAIAVLVAFGLDALFLPFVKPLLRRLTLILLGFGTLTFLILFAIDLAKALNFGVDDRVMMSALAAFLLAGLIYRAGRNDAVRPGLLVLIIGLYIVEIGNVAFYTLPHKEEKNRMAILNAFPDTEPVADFLRRQPGTPRAWPLGDDVQINFGDWYDIDTQFGYTASLPLNIDNMEMHTTRARMLYGAAYGIAKKPFLDFKQEVYRAPSGLIVYKTPDVLPKVWMVHEGEIVKDREDVRRHLQDASFDLSKKTFGWTAPPKMDHCDGDIAGGFSRAINSARVNVNMKCRGMVVMGENNAPGWTAKVDGKPAPIYYAYTTLRGVVVGPGRHTIKMRYQPLSVTAGALSTLAAFIAAFAFFLAPRLRRRNRGL